MEMAVNMGMSPVKGTWDLPGYNSVGLQDMGMSPIIGSIIDVGGL